MHSDQAWPASALRLDGIRPVQRGALEDALQHLYLLAALSSQGAITDLGRRMVQLPLEPVLARTLLAAAELDCLGPALTVVAMLSAETIFQGNRSALLLLLRPADFLTPTFPANCWQGRH